MLIKRRLHIQFLLLFGIIFGANLSLYVAKSLGQSLGQIFCFTEGQFLAQIKYQFVEQIGCVDAALPFKLDKFDLPSHTGCWLCVDAELAIGQCRLGLCMKPVVWTTLGTGPEEDVITGLEFLVDLPM